MQNIKDAGTKALEKIQPINIALGHVDLVQYMKISFDPFVVFRLPFDEQTCQEGLAKNRHRGTHRFCH